jgi:hypothetical protein
MKLNYQQLRVGRTLNSGIASFINKTNTLVITFATLAHTQISTHNVFSVNTLGCSSLDLTHEGVGSVFFLLPGVLFLSRETRKGCF